MSTPRVCDARPADPCGLICGGYGRKHHTVATQTYRIAHSTVYLCWDCLLALGHDQTVPRRAIHLHRRPIR